MVHLELIQFGRILARWWFLVAIPLAVAVAWSAFSLITASPAESGGYSASLSYTAFQSMEAIPRESGDYQDLWLSSELAVNAFTDWVRGSAFKDELLKITPFDAGTLNIAADNQRSVGQIFFTYPDPNVLTQIVSAAQTVLQTQPQAYFAQLGGDPASVSILHLSPVSAAPPSLPNRFAPLIRVGIGLLAGIGLAVLAHYLDPMIREKRDIERAGLPVLAVLPRR
jgi:capsular polysaccharide biosynthesis protein